ncbi:MAG: PAS domain S-box protein [Rhodospirillaceae bacterium]|nr:PAS domain S-box protein [Rhodospirillaceae bacterium]MBT5527350.1 PAS domain S-box protein [Rhodospirillaceae bacterium]MBT5878358.1 PAS domain S-box protein [Rhodospirillaceae bacterium]MBT6590936.1 PAS domain S-box protein [Rhodospirillaceae bacterium]
MELANRGLALVVIWISASLILQLLGKDQSLGQSNTHFDDLIKGSVQGVLIHRNFKPLQVNQTWVEIFGFSSADEVLALDSILELFPSDVQKEFQGYTAARQRGESIPGRYENEAIRRDGRTIWLESIAREVDWAGEPAIQAVVTDITEKKRIEDELLHNQEYLEATVAERTRELHLITENLPVTITRLDMESRYLFVNQQAEQWFNQGADQILGKTVRDVLGEAAHETLTSSLNQAFAGELETVEEEVTYPDGITRFVELSYVPDTDLDGNVQGLFGLAVDVTQRKLVEIESKENARRFRDFSETASDWSWEMDADLRFTYMSDSFAEVFGRPAETSMGKTREDIYFEIIDSSTPEEKQKWHQHFADLRARRPFRNFTQRWTTPAGETRFILNSGKPYFDRSGNFAGYRGTGSNITESVLADQALHETAEQLRLLTNALPVAIIYVDTGGRYQFANQMAEDLVNLPDGSIVGRDQREVLGDEMYRPLEPYVQAALAGETQNFENRVSYPDGTTRDMEFTYVPHLGPQAGVLGYFTLGVDATERHALEERVRQAQKMEVVGQLTGGIAHEFNNLLQVVAGNVSLLQDDAPPASDTGRQLEAIDRNVTRGAELTDRLLSFSRKQPLAPRMLDIDKTLTEMRGLLGQTLGETIEVKVELTADIWAAEADAGQLENALLNLALNARDAMPGGGLIKLSAENASLDEQTAAMHEGVVPGDYVVLSVTDTGSGMTQEDISHAFEPFFTTKDVGKGTGLGLSMVYGFAQQSGGFAKIESTVGQGTTMYLYLPRMAQAEGAAAVAPATRPDTASRGNGTILLVEDNMDVRQSLGGQLMSLGYRVIEAEDGSGALSVLSNGPQIDLLFTDVVMPGGMSGIELARRVLLHWPNLKILYTTGYAEDIVAKAGTLQDDAIMLRKPYDKIQLAAAIAQILK